MTVTRICRHYGISRQAYYKRSICKRENEKQQEVLTQMVKQIREQLPRLGGKKLYGMIKPEVEKRGIKIGRDRFFDYLRSTNQLIRPRKRYVVTTQSSHRFRVYKNLIEKRVLTGPHQVWVSDITYLRTVDGFCYLSLITDAWSRKIVGYEVSDSLELEGCLKALRMAFKQLPRNHTLIHHSDRGIQYCSRFYTSELKKKGIAISMAEKGNCYQNAIAERINGILKTEFYLDVKFDGLAQARCSTKQAIYLYNTLRPHWNLNLKTPQFIHTLS